MNLSGQWWLKYVICGQGWPKSVRSGQYLFLGMVGLANAFPGSRTSSWVRICQNFSKWLVGLSVRFVLLQKIEFKNPSCFRCSSHFDFVVARNISCITRGLQKLNALIVELKAGGYEFDQLSDGHILDFLRIGILIAVTMLLFLIDEI